MGLFADVQQTIDFPQSLSEKYRPKHIADFVGLPKEKKIIGTFLSKPRDAAFLFVGPSGLGKTTMALAMADELKAELHHIPSQKCTVENVDDVIRLCWRSPWNLFGPNAGQPCKFHIVLVDECNFMSRAAQLAFLSKLDATARPPQTIFIFTCNSTESLDATFLSRCVRLEFSSYGMRSDVAQFLRNVWEREVPHSSDIPEPPQPNFERITKDSSSNIRDCLMKLEVELLAL